MTPNLRMTLTVAVACVLTSTVMYPLFDFSQWFYAGIGAVITVAACGALSRVRTLPVVVCLAISVLGLLLYLNLVFEARHSLIGVIPTPNSVARLWDLAGAGMTASRIEIPPTPEIPGLVLLATAGIGITAVLADLIAVRLRSTALAGLPLLVLFTVPVTMKAPSGEGTTVVFCLSAAGYLAMLSADGRERIRVWGRLVSLWRAGSMHDAAPRRGPGGVVTAHNGAADHAAANGPATAVGGARPGLGLLGPEPGPDTRALAAAGRRVGLASVVLALAVPLIVPGLHPGRLFSSGPGIGGGSGTGAAGSALPDALQQTIDDLRESHPTTVLTYTTSAPNSLQENDPQYLREYVFDTLTDDGWSYADYKSGQAQVNPMPPPQGLTITSSALQVTTTVDVEPGVVSSGSAPTFLPVPYPPIQVYSVISPGIWLTDSDGMVFSQGNSGTVRSYVVRSLAVNPSPGQLEAAPAPPADVVAAYTQLPASYKIQALKALADTYTSGMTTEYAKVDALALWLGGSGFTYSPSAPYFDNAAGLLQFLTKGRSGVCVQFAYAMTVLTRLLGIPARMVQGFTQGTPTSADSYVVKTSDAHAWTEVYFAGYGWLRFEPTPGGQGTARHPDYMGGGSGSGNISPGSPGSGSHPSPATSSPGSGLSARKPTSGSGGTGAGSSGRPAGTPWAAIVLAVAAAIALACGVVAIAAPPAHRVLSRNAADQARRRRPVTATMVVLVAAAAAIVALALYRLLPHASGLELRSAWATVGIAFGAACAVMLVVPAVGRIWLRQWRWMLATDDASRAHTAWREFCDDLEDLGLGYRPSEPPRTLANRVTSGLPVPVRDAIRRLALAEERASYAARPSGSANLRRDGAAARRGIAASARRGSRWRARIFPASVLVALADAAARIPDRAAALIPRRWTERRSAG